jgi:putative transcriptional regulator
MESYMTIDKTKFPFADEGMSGDITDADVDALQMEMVGSLKNHFLIAMPSLTDPYFKKSVVYLCEHDQHGAMGFIINYPVKLTVQELLSNAECIDHQPTPPINDPVFLGGPLDMERGFILHSPTKENVFSMPLNEDLMMSNSNAILCSLGTDKGPKQFMIALGYSSWDAGQLEDEINNNQWLTLHCENDIIFNTPIEQRWACSLQRLGIKPSQLSNNVGHA